MFYNVTQLTTLAKVKYGKAFDHNVEVFVTYTGEVKCFVVKVKRPIPQSGDESTIFGKAIRIILYLQNNYELNAWLNVYDVPKVMVTEATAPEYVNPSNTVAFSTQFILSVYKDILAHRQVSNYQAETNIQRLIKQSKLG